MSLREKASSSRHPIHCHVSTVPVLRRTRWPSAFGVITETVLTAQFISDGREELRQVGEIIEETSKTGRSVPVCKGCSLEISSSYD
jgi:hypothetical protein